MRDTIYRDEAVKAVWKPQVKPNELIFDALKTAIESEINNVPSADIPTWIPCSERLPKEKDAGILKKLGTEKRSEYVLATVEVKGERMTVTACTYDGVWQWDKKYAFPDFKVVAWMPLPEPWKGADDDCV